MMLWCHDFQTAAENLHKENINVYSIGVGAGVNQDELKLMASDPANVFNVNNFDALHTIQLALKKSSCEGNSNEYIEILLQS